MDHTFAALNVYKSLRQLYICMHSYLCKFCWIISTSLWFILLLICLGQFCIKWLVEKWYNSSLIINNTFIIVDLFRCRYNIISDIISDVRSNKKNCCKFVITEYVSPIHFPWSRYACTNNSTHYMELFRINVLCISIITSVVSFPWVWIGITQPYHFPHAKVRLES